jgi:PilZ domain-containing protein
MDINDQPYDFYEESRKYPRVKVKLPVQLTLDNDRCVSASIYDISPDGLQIRCNRETAAVLNPGGKKIDQEHNLTVKAVFSLPIDYEQKKITVSCEVYYFVIVPGDTEEDVAFGLQFKKFEGQSIKYIGRHILSELEPVTEPFDNNTDSITRH